MNKAGSKVNKLEWEKLCGAKLKEISKISNRKYRLQIQSVASKLNSSRPNYA